MLRFLQARTLAATAVPSGIALKLRLEVSVPISCLVFLENFALSCDAPVYEDDCVDAPVREHGFLTLQLSAWTRSSRGYSVVEWYLMHALAGQHRLRVF